MKRLLLSIIFLLIVLLGCRSAREETAVVPTDPPPTVTPIPPTPQPPTEEPANAALEQALQAIVEAQVEAGFPGVILMVDAPDMGFTWQGAGGMANTEANITMTPDTPFRIASISKMMMATMILRMAEDDLLALDDPISQYLDTVIIDMLHGPNGEPYGEMITIRQLLSHTSGVADYFSPTAPTGVEPFVDIFIDDPDKVWTPPDVIEKGTSTLGAQFAPGESWDYSNTNYVLAGLVVEEVTGMSLSEAYNEWLFTPLGMEDTFMAGNKDTRLSDVAHVYFDIVDVSDYASLSWQWGMGGVVSTASDLNKFMWAWEQDKIFRDPASKEAMTDWTSMATVGFDNLYYGLGVIDIDFGGMGDAEVDEIMGHNGMFNSFLYYWPKYNMTIIGTLNQASSSDAYTGPVGMTFQAVLEHTAAQ